MSVDSTIDLKKKPNHLLLTQETLVLFQMKCLGLFVKMCPIHMETLECLGSQMAKE
jgi:hypothetical protein